MQRETVQVVQYTINEMANLEGYLLFLYNTYLEENGEAVTN